MSADLDPLMELFSRPRPAGSAAERAVFDATCAWLAARHIPYRIHEFRLRPFFFECTGLWLIASRTLLALAVARGWGWRTLPLALLGQLGGAADVLGVPLVTWPGATSGQNLVLRFGPSDASTELVVCAHYDSKTELLDHRQRAVLLRGLRPAIALTIASAVFASAEERLRATPPLDRIARALALCCAVPVLLLAWALGLHLLLGRLAQPSRGAVDNGAACVVLLALAERLAAGAIPLERTRVTLVLFGGEEVNMQGSAAFVRSHYPAAINAPQPQAVNLELLGQRGPYILWQQDGNALRSAPASPAMIERVRHAITATTGQTAQGAPLINSDAWSFLSAGIPAATLGTADPQCGTNGMHRPSDNPDRVDTARLHEHVAVLETLIRYTDASTASRLL
jgi:hypothetical protein